MHMLAVARVRVSNVLEYAFSCVLKMPAAIRSCVKLRIARCVRFVYSSLENDLNSQEASILIMSP